MTEKYMTGKQASKILGVHTRTLYQWDEKKWIDTIRTPGNTRLYNVEKYLKENGKVPIDVNIIDIDEINEGGEEKLNISYVRVSSTKQSDDLERQKEMVKEKNQMRKAKTQKGKEKMMSKNNLKLKQKTKIKRKDVER